MVALSRYRPLGVSVVAEYPTDPFTVEYEWQMGTRSNRFTLLQYRSRWLARRFPRGDCNNGGGPRSKFGRTFFGASGSDRSRVDRHRPHSTVDRAGSDLPSIDM